MEHPSGGGVSSRLTNLLSSTNTTDHSLTTQPSTRRLGILHPVRTQGVRVECLLLCVSLLPRTTSFTTGIGRGGRRVDLISGPLGPAQYRFTLPEDCKLPKDGRRGSVGTDRFRSPGNESCTDPIDREGRSSDDPRTDRPLRGTSPSPTSEEKRKGKETERGEGPPLPSS